MRIIGASGRVYEIQDANEFSGSVSGLSSSSAGRSGSSSKDYFGPISIPAQANETAGQMTARRDWNRGQWSPYFDTQGNQTGPTRRGAMDNALAFQRNPQQVVMQRRAMNRGKYSTRFDERGNPRLLRRQPRRIWNSPKVW